MCKQQATDTTRWNCYYPGKCGVGQPSDSYTDYNWSYQTVETGELCSTKQLCHQCNDADCAEKASPCDMLYNQMEDNLCAQLERYSCDEYLKYTACAKLCCDQEWGTTPKQDAPPSSPHTTIPWNPVAPTQTPSGHPKDFAVKGHCDGKTNLWEDCSPTSGYTCGSYIMRNGCDKYCCESFCLKCGD